MSYESILPQERFFYEGLWDEMSVNAFIHVLIAEKNAGRLKVNCNNTLALQNAHEYVNMVMDKDYSWNDVITQRDMLKKRYLTFKAMLEFEGVSWDRCFNHVYALSPLWIQMTRAHDFAKAYYHKGDIMYDKLRDLFAYDHDISNEVINVSSGDPMDEEPNSALKPLLISDFDSEQEVNSPVVVGRNSLRKKLFNDSDENMAIDLVSAESKNHAGPSDPPINAIPPPPQHMKNHARVVKKEHSSCESNSPLKWAPAASGDK